MVRVAPTRERAAAGVAVLCMGLFGGVPAATAQAGAGPTTLVITNVLNDLSVDVDVQNAVVARAVCGGVSDSNAVLVNGVGDAVAVLACEVSGPGSHVRLNALGVWVPPP